MMRRMAWALWLFSGTALAQDVASLPGTYEAVQRVPESLLKSQGIGPKGGNSESIGPVGQPIAGSLTLGPDHTFSISMAYIDEGTWETLRDEKQSPFLRFTGQRDTFDAVFQGEYGMTPGALGVWMKEGEEWFLVEFNKSVQPGFTTSSPYSATEAAMASMFGQGEISVDRGEVAKGSASGARVAGDAFSKKVRFASYQPPSAAPSDERVVLIFAEDHRFTIQNTGTNAIQKGTYTVGGTEVRLRLEGAAEEDVWDLGRDAISGKFAIRPQATGGNFFLEVPFDR